MKYLVLILLCFATLGAKAGAVNVCEANLMGIKVSPVTAEIKARLNLSNDKGILISEIRRGSIADEYGFKKDDVILKIGNKELSNIDDLCQIAKTAKSPSEMNITFIRQGKILNKKMLIMPANSSGVVIA